MENDLRNQAISEIRQELQKQLDRYHVHMVHHASRDREESEYYRGKADGIREALRAYERGL